MKVLHINTGQDGGAALCAMRINNALAAHGINSKMLFAEGKSLPDGVEGAIAEKDGKSLWYSNSIFGKIKHLLMRTPWYYDEEKMFKILEEINTEHLYLHQPFTKYTNIAHHPFVEWADVIHLHWVPDFVDYPTFFKQVKKPIVWTLHDKYPAVGLQHYCSEFSPVPEYLKQIDTICRKIKREGVLKSKKLHIVAISTLDKDICSESDVLKGIPCTIIHNGVDTKIFTSIEACSKKEVLAMYCSEDIITDRTKLFMFSAFGIWDNNKGLQRVIDAFEKTEQKEIALIVVGGNFENLTPTASFPIIATGLITDQTELAKLYSISDYFISASYEETFGQTITEAMACGCPVISTPTGVAPDLIHPFNGVICNGFDSNALAEGIKKALSTEYNPTRIRQHIIDEYDYSKIAQQYIELYNGILVK